MKNILLTLMLLSPLAFSEEVNLACESNSEFEIQIPKPDTKFESVTINSQALKIIIGTETYDYFGEGNTIKYFHDYELGGNRQGKLDRYTGKLIDSIFDRNGRLVQNYIYLCKKVESLF